MQISELIVESRMKNKLFPLAVRGENRWRKADLTCMAKQNTVCWCFCHWCTQRGTWRLFHSQLRGFYDHGGGRIPVQSVALIAWCPGTGSIMMWDQLWVEDATWWKCFTLRGDVKAWIDFTGSVIFNPFQQQVFTRTLQFWDKSQICECFFKLRPLLSLSLFFFLLLLGPALLYLCCFSCLEVLF